MSLFKPKIEKLKSRRDVPGLIDALHDAGSSERRRQAAQGLGELGDARAVEPLIDELVQRTYELNQRWSDLSAPWAIGIDPDPTRDRKQAIRDAEAAVGTVIAALVPFGEGSDLAAIGALLSYRQSEKPWGETVNSVLEGFRTVDNLVHALEAVGLPDFDFPVIWGRAVDAVPDDFEHASSIRVKPWSPMDSDQARAPTRLATSLRTWAAEELGELRDSRAVDPLIGALTASEDDVSGAAFQALSGMGADALIAALATDDSEVRREIANSLGARGESGAADALFEVLEREQGAARLAYAAALAKLGDARALEPLLSLLETDDDVQVAAIDALGDLGDKHSVEPLIRTFCNVEESHGVRSAARAALERIGGRRAEQAVSHNAPRVGDRVQVTMWEVVNAGKHDEHLGRAGEWTGTVASISKRRVARVHWDEGPPAKVDTTDSMKLDETEADDLPDADGHWWYRIQEGAH